ncbi:MAG: hypothetical protein FWC40_02450 [Proteobacteria bacterium]|nr:hypothetical protein [Pseudomonadota bacterium]
MRACVLVSVLRFLLVIMVFFMTAGGGVFSSPAFAYPAGEDGERLSGRNFKQERGSALCSGVEEVLRHRHLRHASGRSAYHDLIFEAVRYAVRMRCVEARESLLGLIGTSDWEALDALAFRGVYEMADVSILPEIIHRLDTAPDVALVYYLRLMSRVCDASCVPFVGLLLRHTSREVVMSACRTARILGSPVLESGLLDLALTSGDVFVRDAALASIVGELPPSAYRQLFARHADIGEDIYGIRLVRRLPESLSREMAPQFAQLARRSGLVSSVVEAYAHDPMLLFEAIVSEYHADEVGGRMETARVRQGRAQLLRALKLVVANMPESVSVRLDTAVIQRLPGASIQELALIMASIPTSPAARWIIARFADMDGPVMVEIFERLRGEALQIVVDQLVSEAGKGGFAEPGGGLWERVLLGGVGVERAFYAMLARSPHAGAVEIALGALLASDRDSIRFGLWALAPFAGVTRVRSRILDLLGHEDAAISYTAMQVAIRGGVLDSRLWEMIDRHRGDDRYSRVYLARWIIAEVLALGGVFDEASPGDAVEEALTVVREPGRLHAEPALRLLEVLRVAPPSLTEEAFGELRSDMKCAWMRAEHAAGRVTDERMVYALQYDDPALNAFVLGMVSDKHGELPFLPDYLKAAIASVNPLVSVNAIAAAGRIQMLSSVPGIRIRLWDDDTRVAYNALWALEKLHALPPQDELERLYRSSSDDFFRTRLGVLTGMGQGEDFDLNRGVRVEGPFFENSVLSVHHQGYPGRNVDVTYFLNDQSVSVQRVNILGLLSVGGR